MATPATSVKLIALTQEHRGHGISTAGFFLSRALATQHIPILLADLTGRHSRLAELNEQFPTPRLVVWAPPQGIRDVPALIARMRGEIAGKARGIVLDADLSTLEKLIDAPHDAMLDYLVIATEPTPERQLGVTRVAERFEDLHTRQRIGVVFARVSNQQTEDMPQETESGLPILGYWPADYRLATAEDYSAADALTSEPSQAYQAALTRLASSLIRLTGLNR